MEQIFDTISRIFNRKQEQLYLHALKLWNDMLDGTNFAMEERHAVFVFEKILPILFHNDVNVKLAAYQSFENSIVYLKRFDYRSIITYPKYYRTICEELAPKIKNEMLNGNVHWHQIWCNLIGLIQQDVAKSIMINSFLQVAEAGFRNSDNAIRTKQFICWRKLIEVFAKEGQLKFWKRVKLVVTPLSATPSKTLEMAIEKFKCWWFLMNHIHNEICRDPSLCLEPFLIFCFGPISDCPLISYTRDTAVVSPGKMYPELSLPVVIALISILGKNRPETVLVRDFNMMEKFENTLNLGTVYVDCKKLLIYSCAEATVLLAIKQKPALAKNLWSNLYGVIRESDEGTEASFELIMESLDAMIKLSNSDAQYACLKPILGTVLEVISMNPIFPFGIPGCGFGALSKAVVNLLDILQMTDPNIISDNNLTKFLFDFLIPGYQKIAGVDNKLSFIGHICYKYRDIEFLGENVERNFFVYKFILTEMCLKMQKGVDHIIDFLNFGFEKHYTSMVTDHESWLQNWKGMPSNQYLNAAAKELQKNSPSHSLSYDNVEMFDDLMSKIDVKFDSAETAPKDILNLYVDYYSKFQVTEFGEKFIEMMTKFLTNIGTVQAFLLTEELTKILDLMKQTPQVSMAMKKFRQKIAQRANIMELDTSLKKNEKVQAFIVFVKKWAESKKEQPQNGKEDFVVVKSNWNFNPKVLTEHQLEKMKERRDDIPALYNDNTMSQDSHSIQPWTSKPVIASVSSLAKPASPVPTTSNGSKSPVKSHEEEKENSAKLKELKRLKIDIVNGDSFGQFNDGPTVTRNRLKDAIESPPKRLRKRRHSSESVEAKRESPKLRGPEPKRKSAGRPKSSTSVKENDKPEKSRRSVASPITTETVKEKPTPKETVPNVVKEDNTKEQSTSKNDKEKIPENKTTEPPPTENIADDTEPVTESMLEAFKANETSVNGKDLFDLLKEDNVSVIPGTDDTTINGPKEAEPMDTSGVNQCSIVSSPELDNAEQRDATFMSDTLNISPIPKQKETEEVAPPALVAIEPKIDDILTTPKRNMEKPSNKEVTTPTVIPPPNIINKLSSRGAQMLSLNKMKAFTESTPKEKGHEESTNLENDRLQKMLKAPRIVNSPRGSPSTSILRRKRLEESMEEYESPATKKKKVSFSDPPVSKTKEFERDSEQANLRPMIPVNKLKAHRLFQRHSKSSIHKLLQSDDAVPLNGVNESDSDSEIDYEEDDAFLTGDHTETSLKPKPALQFEDEDDMFKYLKKRYGRGGSSEDETKPQMTIAQSSIVTDILLEGITKNERISSNVLSKLTSEIPDEILNYMLQELNTNIILDKVPKRDFANRIKHDDKYTSELIRVLYERTNTDFMMKLIAKMAMFNEK